MITRFRTVSHSLAVEKLSWSNVPREQRICGQCNLGVVEDEQHHVFECSLYDIVRVEFRSLFRECGNDLDRFLNHNNCGAVGQFLLNCDRPRNSL